MRSFKVGNTTYKRSNLFGVGKYIGGKLYVHKNYAIRVVDYLDYSLARACLPDGFQFNCIVVDYKKETIRFDEAPDFDTAREPHPGDFYEVSLNTWKIRKGHSDFIWHHKWMWVDDDYKGFDVNKAYEWSKEWTQYITHPSGSKSVWLKQLQERR